MLTGSLHRPTFDRTCSLPFALSPHPDGADSAAITGLSEEIGGRGCALPELERKFSAEKPSWILGILWCLWHLPSALVIPFIHGELDIAIIGVTLLGLTLGIVGWTIVITWIYNYTQSVFRIILLHGLTTLVQSYRVLSQSFSSRSTGASHSPGKLLQIAFDAKLLDPAPPPGSPA